MHDGHVHGSCADCVSFVSAFPDSRALRDWGYCEKQTPEPPDAALVARLGESYLSGNKAPLLKNSLGIFRSEEDDACDFIRFRDW